MISGRRTMDWAALPVPGAAMALAAVFVASDRTTQFLQLCGKDLSFSLAVTILAVIILFPQDIVRSWSVRGLALLAAIVFTVAGAERLPDSWLIAQAGISRSLPVIEVTWAAVLGLALVAGFLFGRLSARAGLPLLAVFLLAGAAARFEAAERADASARMIPVQLVTIIDAGGGFVGRDWLIAHTDYEDVAVRLRAGVDASWSGALLNESRERRLELDFVEPRGAELRIYGPHPGAGILSAVMIWFALTLALISWFSLGRMSGEGR